MTESPETWAARMAHRVAVEVEQVVQVVEQGPAPAQVLAPELMVWVSAFRADLCATSR